MRNRFVALSLASALLAAACSSDSSSVGNLDLENVQFWRPISVPNVLLQSDVLQRKVAFDLSQCKCGVYPVNATRDDLVTFRPDEQRLAQTDATIVPDAEGQCHHNPSLVVSECMRHRGWEPTTCSGRLSLPNGGALCASYNPLVKAEE